MARRKNKRRFDPRYFMNEREEQVNEKIYGPDDPEYDDAHREDKESRADVRRARERKNEVPDWDISHLSTPGEKVGWWEDDRFERGDLPGAVGSSIEPTAELDFLHSEEEEDLNIPAGVRAYMDRLKDSEKLEEGRNRSMKNIMENFSFDNWPVLNEAPGMFDPHGPEDEDASPSGAGEASPSYDEEGDTEEIDGEDEETEETMKTMKTMEEGFGKDPINSLEQMYPTIILKYFHENPEEFKTYLKNLREEGDLDAGAQLEAQVEEYAVRMTSGVKPEDLNEDFEDLEET